MRQRVMIAMALALHPDVIVMDEPTTALDVVVQRDILDEIGRLSQMLGFAIIFITHDLSLLLEISDQVAIMYAGRFVEYAPAADLFLAPRHPYTVGLLNSFPSLRGQRQPLHGIPGSPPDLAHVPSGCPFRPRCPYRFSECTDIDPPLYDVSVGPRDGRTLAACLQYDRALRPDGPDGGLLHKRFEVERLRTPLI
jgi:peptide/nickel transport system ATP-binding protein